MKYNYDVIVIGAGNAGLMAALTIAEKGKKVLVLESNSGPGGLATSFVRGRFEFEASLRELKSVGSETDKGILRKIFDEYDLNEKIEWIELPEAYKLIKKSTQKEIYSIPFGVDEFIKKMEEYVPESKDKLTEFFELLKEVYEAVQYIENSNEEINYDYFKEKYPNFSTVSSYSLQTVLDRLKMPQKLQELISSYWIYFGASSININFAHYASAFYELLTKKAYIPKNRSYELSCIIERKIRNYGGKVWYNEEVKNIIVQDNKVIGVKTQNGNTYTTNYVVCNSSPFNLYSSLIDSKSVPQYALKLTNSRKLGNTALTIYSGLNKSAENLGINNYMYFLYNSLDSNVEFEGMKSISSNTMIVTCLNNAIKDASPSETTILNITALYVDNCWDKVVNEENYYAYKEKIASKLIEELEKALEVNIKEYIEEIEISTPVTYSKQNASPDGCVNGYMVNNVDSILARTLNKNEEYLLNGLRTCGSYSYYGSGYDSTYRNGYEVGKSILKDIEKGDN